MPRKGLLLMLAFSLFFSVSLVFPRSFERAHLGQINTIQQSDLRVRNLNTGKSYSTIQEAIDASETSDGHELFVGSGTYHEHVIVNKSLVLIGEDRSSTIIDGDGKGKVVHVTADNVEVRGFTIRKGTFGLLVDNAQNSKIIGNTLHEGPNGIRLYYSRNSEVIGNLIYGFSSFGVEVDSSGNSTLRDNSIADNKYNFGVNGNSLSDFINDIDVSNTVNGKPVRYLINQHNIIIDSSTFKEMGYLGLVNSTNIIVKNLNVHNNNKQGILFAYTSNCTIRNVDARSNWNGIYVAHSSNISASENKANNNFDYGIKFFNSPRSVASGNNVDNNGWAGIGIFHSPNSTIEKNEANLNTYSLHIVYTNNSVITENNALVKSRGYSIAVYYSHSNLIYRNAFANCFLHVETRNETRFTPRNSWDNGLEGNYWSSYRGVDSDQDGIGDTPYVIGENNTDNHPLMGEFSDFTVTLGEKNYSIGVVSNSTVSQFQFDPDDMEISFNAAAENETMGFSRVAVPNAFIHDLHGSDLSFLINGEQPVLKRNWTEGLYTYFYFSYVNSVSELAISPWLIATVAFVFLVASVLVLLVLKKKLRILSRLSREKVSDANEKERMHYFQHSFAKLTLQKVLQNSNFLL